MEINLKLVSIGGDMTQLIFTFTTNMETQETTFAGNIEPQIALQVLQSIVVQTAAKQLQNEAERIVKEREKGQDIPR